MATATDTATKPSNTPGGGPNQAPAAKLGDMLTRADYGLHITGRVDAISDVVHRSGLAKNGNQYSFYQETACISVGGSMYEVGYRADEDPRESICGFQLDQVVKIKVGSPRIYNGKASFDAILD